MIPPNLENKKILVVEDDEMSYLYLSQLFTLTKGEIWRAKSGREAMEFYLSHTPFALILMDIQLPDGDGTDLTRTIRKHDKHIPIIAQTAGKSAADIENALDAGCSRVLTKPFSMEEFFDAIAFFL